VYDFVRALTRPYPGAFTHLDGERWMIWSCALLPECLQSSAAPGTVIGPVRSPEPRACGQAVACREGSLVLCEVEAPDGHLLLGTALSDVEWKGRRFLDG
jgi:methionyl-tRNA formyltransferase